VETPEVSALVDQAKLAEREGRWSDAAVRYEALIRNPFANDHTRLSALRWLGRAYLEQGNRGAAIDVLEAAVAAATQAGSPSAIAQALNVVAIVHQTGGDLDRAESMYTEARITAQSIKDAEALAMIDQNLGTVASIRGDVRRALEAFHLSLDGYRALGMREPILWAYGPQAEVLTDTLHPSLVVYHCVDDIASQAGIDAAGFRDAEARFAAGADLVLFSHTVNRVRAAHSALCTAVLDGTLAHERVRRSLERVRSLRARLAHKPPALELVGSAAHQSAALEAARRAITLIRDPKGVLPLPLASSERLFVVQFSGAPASAVEDDKRAKAECAGPPHSRFVTAIGRALAQGPARVHEQVRGLDPAGHEYKQMLMAAGSAQVVVAVTSRAKQHPLQARAVADLAMIGKPMVVIASREPYDAEVLPPDATVIASYGDDPHALRAAADVILGASLPQGKLPVRLSAAASPTH